MPTTTAPAAPPPGASGRPDRPANCSRPDRPASSSRPDRPAESSPAEPRAAALARRAAAHVDLLWRALMHGDDVHVDAHCLRLATGLPHPLGNALILRRAMAPARLRAAVAPLLAMAAPATVVCTAGLAPAAVQALRACGFDGPHGTPLMAVDLAALAPTTLPPGCEWLRITTPADAAQWTDVVAGSFGLPRALARRFSPELLGADAAPGARTQFFGVRRGGRLVATSMLHRAGGLAGLYCVATVADERGRGLGAHVSAEALRTARRLGCRTGVLQSSDAGHAVYRGLGLRDVGSLPTFMRPPAAPA